LQKKYLVNNQIKAEKVRIIDQEGKNLGIFLLEEALRMARERNLDLVQITEKVDPPVCKLIEYGKFLYWLRKKERKMKKTAEMKTIKIGFNISPHDLEIKIRQAEKFLREGNKVKLEIFLKGRQTQFADLGKEKLEKTIQFLNSLIPIKTEGEIKKVPSGFSAILTKK
jgi:translation initiation factor IF-3